MTVPTRPEAVVIGVSAGAMEALGMVLPRLPADFPLPVMIVVHLRSDKKNMIVDLFQPKCRMSVKEAEDKEPIQPGTIYFAPSDYHLLVEKNKILSLSSEEPVLFSRPSIDVLFETAADAYGAGLIGVILTGASNDGSAGLKAVGAGGSVMLVQRPETAYAGAMPQSALHSCPDAQAMSLDEIAGYLVKAVAL